METKHEFKILQIDLDLQLKIKIKCKSFKILSNNNWIVKGMIGCYFSTCIFTGKHESFHPMEAQKGSQCNLNNV